MQEHPVHRVAGFFHAGVAQRFQKLVEGGVVRLWYLQPYENAAVVGALVAVVKQTDIPACLWGL